MSVELIGDHRALACSNCGSVRFWLLKSGGIECSGCQQRMQDAKWSESDDD